MKKPTHLLQPIMVCLSFLVTTVGYFNNSNTPNQPKQFSNAKRGLSHTLALLGILFFMIQGLYGQEFKDFTIRKKIETRGKMILAGNTILGQNNLPNNNNTINNQDISMKYIDIDTDATTFSSSSADLVVPNQSNGSVTTCYRVQYAALYWAATLKSGDGNRANINQVKLKLPGAASYTPITGQVIYDAIVSPIPAGSGELPNTPYACYADVTNLINSLSSISGTYTVADVLASQGSNGSTGLSAGWSLYVVYEDPTLTMKSFNVFDGFSAIFDGKIQQMDVSGFTTPPSGNVDLQMAYASLDGDKTVTGTKLEIDGKEVTTPFRSPSNRFFNASIENTNGVQTPRNPSGSNTLGYDTGVLEILGANPAYVKNNQTSTSFTLQVAKGQSDPVFAFFAAYAVDIIAPKVDLTKLVKSGGVNIGGGNVNLGQYLTYEISYQSVGNDNVTNFTIKDVLPVNVTFNPLTDIDLSTAGGATLQSYDPVTRTLIFKIPDASVQVNDGIFTIRLNVRVATDCNSLVTACSNEIKNQAFATYQGVINPTVVKEEGSFASVACKLGSPDSTNFLVDISKCTFARTVYLCGASVVLKAADGYAGYSWSRNRDGSNPIGTGQTFTATQPGIYYVHNTAPLTCKDVVEEITVSYFGVTNTNPVIPFADKVATCPNDGKALPYIFLCGANATRSIVTGISDAQSITWEKLNEASCPSVAPNDCANESFAPSCWNSVGTGPNYVANTSGQFRVILRYANGCQSIFYFNVYQNPLNPTFTKKDMICGSPGEISVGGIPTGYEFSLDGTNYVPNSPTFAITTPGVYTVYIKQIGVPTFPCIFTIPAIVINNRQMNVRTFVTQPTCNGAADASIKLIAENVDPQYFFSVYKGATLVNSVGPIMANDYTLPNLGAGTYTVNVSTSPANCSYTATINIIDPAPVQIQANLTKPLTCTNGEVTVTVTGGTPNFNYYVNGTSVSLNDPSRTLVLPISASGTYVIKAVDLNKCEATTSIDVSAIAPPVFTVTKKDILCHGTNSGAINFNVTNANGYTLDYSIDNGLTFSTNPVFSNLAPATYVPVVRYSLSGVSCLLPQTPITITEPAAAVTASAGVAELAGCSLPDGSGVNQGGKLRITNPQGGTAPYTYSFDGGLSWQNSPEKNVLPGTYSLKIRDNNGCEFNLPAVILDPRPLDPTLAVSPPVFNCDGTATSTVTVTNPGGVNYTYEYLIDGTPNVPITNNVFTGVTTGPHVVSVKYKLTSVPTYSVLLTENFGSGNPTTTTGIAAAYCFNDLRVNAPYLCGTRSVEDNQYSVTNDFWRSDDPSGTNVGAWFHFKDHTTNPNNLPGVGDARGRFLLVNIGSAAGPNGVLYSKPIIDVIPNQPVKVDFAVANLLRAGKSGAAPDILVQLVDPSGTVVAQQNSGKIAELPSDPNRNKWVPVSLTLNPGNNTNLTFVVRSGSILYNGNDVVIDDITVYQLPATCITQKDFPIVIDSGKAFAAQIVGKTDVTCAGANNGAITIAAQNFDPIKGFQYSKDNGVTWSTSLISPVTIPNLAPNIYAILIRPDATALATCSQSFSVTITAPSPVALTASVTKVATCTTGATITAVGSGGTPAYQYELRQANGTTVVTAFSNNGGIFTNVPAGSYTVFVRDANGCFNLVGVPVTVVAPPALTASLAATTDYCYTTADPARLDVTISGGVEPFTYQLDGNAAVSSAATTYSFTNVAPGTHTIVVTDSNNCTATIPNIIIAPQIGLTVALINDLSCLADAIIGNPVVTGGNGGPYNYTVTHGGTTTVATFPFTASTAGTYVFNVTDSKGCTANSNTITVTPKTTPTITVAKTDITCNNANDGTITVTAAGGFTSAYTYAIKLSSVATYTTQTTNKFTGLAAGVYDVKVIDSKGCESAVTQVTIVNPTVLVVSASATAFSCSPTNIKQAAVVTIGVPTTGTAPYTYSFNGGSFTNTNTLTVNDNGTDQIINYAVRDASNCVTTGSITLNRLNPPTIATITNTPIYCAPASSTTSTVTVPVTAGTGVAPLTYTIVSGPVTNSTGATTGIFSGLTAGTYVFRVTDANGCYATKSHTVPALTPIAVTATKLTDVDCFGNTTGSIRYNVSGFSGTYSYTINGGTALTGLNATTFTLPNLGANTYSVVFTDETTGCTAPTSVTITQPTAALALSLVSNKNANCNVATARVEVAATGGTPNYRYSFVTSATTPGAYGNSPIANLNPSTSTSWYAHVIDAKGCTFVLPITIATDPTPTVTATATGQCLGAGSFTITATNTTPASGIVNPITYSLNGGTFQSGNTFTVTASGDYIVRIKDGNGCIVPAATITVVPQLTLNAVLNKDITCNPAPTAASITLTPTGGSGSFTYESKEALGAFTPMASNIFTTNTAGSYTFRVTDTVTGCTYTTTTAIAVTTPVNPDITGLTQTAFINCNGDDTAAISIALDNTKGQSPFVFNVLNTTTGINYGTQTSGLSAGDYLVTVTDAKGCTNTETITITEPTPITFVRTVTPITCNSVTGISLGSITINSVSGGTPNYTYHVTGVNGYDVKFNNQTGTTAVFDVVDFGLYQIIITDANGCTAFENNILVASPPDDLDITVTPVGPTCAGLGSAEVAIGASTSITGSGPFHFAVYSPGLTYTGPTTLPWYDEDAVGSKKTTIPNLIPGVTYTFIVHDGLTGCYYFETSSIAVPTNSTITVNPLTPNNITCKGAADGNVSFTMNHTYGFDTPVTYQIYNSQSVTPVGSSVATTIPASGSLVISNFGTLPFGNYFVLVTETGAAPHAGCSISSAPFDITESAIDLSITANVIKNSNCNDLGIITGQAKDGTAPYSYQVTTSATPPLASDVNWVSTNTFTRAGSLAGTTYYVYAKDAYGCIKSDDVILLQDAPPTITAPAPICYNGTAFTINLVTDASATATIVPATYSVNGSAFQNSPSFTFNAAGTYNLVIKDGNGCEANVDFVVLPKLELSAAVTKALDCTSSPNAEITLTANGGTTTPLPYIFEYSTTGGAPWTTMTTNVLSASTAGTYTFRVTDANNTTTCQTTTSIVLDPIPTTVFTTTETNVSCNGGSDGTITVNVTAGEGPYEYSLTDGVTTTPFQTSNQFTGLAAGTTYVVTVRNAKQCTLPSSPITISEPSAITASAAVTTPLSCGTGNITQQATVTVTASGGTGVLEYSFDGGANYSTVNTYTTNIPGLVSVLVKDANGCPIAAAVTADVLPLNPPTQMDINGTPVYCAPLATTSTVTISNVQNGVTPYTYQIISPIAAMIDNLANPVFAGLAPDTYVFQVTDANGCTYQESYTVAPVNNITVAVSATTDVTCFGDNNGSATFKVTDFTNYTAVLTTGTGGTITQAADIVTLTGLAPGAYTLQVTDATTGCTADVSFAIAQPTVLDLTLVSNVNANCNSGAIVTVQGTGGTPSYTYAFVADGVTPIATDYTASNNATLAVTLPSPNNYDVWVQDANGCKFKLDIVVVMDANPVLNGVAFTECPDPINGTYTFTINTPTGVGPFEYSIGGGFQTSPIFVVNAPGSYDVTVKDKNGCTTTVPALVVIRQPLILTPTVSTPVSCADNDGVITVSATGGSGSYLYNIDGSAFASVTSFPNVSSGNHIIGVQDTTTLCEVFATVNLQVATPITGFALAKTEVTCNGGTDGTITASMDTPTAGVNDNPVYTYTLTGTTTVGNLPVTRPSQASPLFSGLAAGTYTVVVTSGRGCTDTETITIIEPGLITVPAPTVVEFGCTSGNTSNLATITVTGVTGGTAPYLNYEFIKNGTRVQFGSNNVYTEADLLGGSYVVNVFDSNGCSGTTTAPITIAPFVQLDKVNVNVINAITCTNLEDIAVSVSAIGGTPTNLQFTVRDVIIDSSVTPPTVTKGTVYNFPPVSVVAGVATFTNLPVGNYEITVRNVDTNCEITGVHFVNEPNTFDLTIDNIVDVTCFGTTTGSARVTLIDRVPLPTNEAGPFTYTLVDALGNSLPSGASTAAGVVDLTNLAAGTYTITATLTNTPYCTVSKNFTITGPSTALVISETHTAITCVPGNNGSISATATGGWPGGYEFELLGPLSVAYSTQSVFTGLTAGTYTVNVRDTKGCVATTTVTLVNPTPIAFTTTTINQALQCNGDTTASITVNAPTGGQGSNYLYTLNTISASPVRSSGPQASNVFANLGAGTYTVTVTDGWGCSTTTVTPIVITEPTKVAATLVVATTPTCLTDATLTLSATGGTGTYEYGTTATGPWSTMVGATATITVTPGTYRYYVRDANGCVSQVSNAIVIDPLPPLTVKLDVLNAKINCKGDTTGVIVATATGGLGNYIYTLLDGAGNPVGFTPVQTTPGTFTQLPAGTYSVRVNSGGDCQVISVSELIEEPMLPVTASAVATPITCNGAANGIITVTASGGTGVIKYAISPQLNQFFDTGVFDQLAPGTYDILVQDENGCFIFVTQTITEPTAILVATVAGSEVQELCAGDLNAAFDVNITGGVAPYSVALDTINGTYVTGTLTQTVFNFTGLAGGEHTVYIKDANGCTAEWIVTLDESVTLDPKAIVAYGCDNNSPSNTVTVTVDASITNPADVDYALDGSTVFQASNIFRNVAPGFHTVTARHTNGCEKVTASFEVLGFTPLALTLADGGLNEIVATATGGAGNYQYSFDGGNTFSSNNKLIYYKSGDYTVIVRDANGCEATAMRYFEFIDIEIPNVFTPNGDGNNDTWTPTNTINYKDLTISIFDRYGRKIATLREGQGWDGRYNNLELPTGDYWYILKLRNVQDDREFVGHFTLMR
ncbi:T9SS type B sorting domain-containing protein [Flavobacterium sp. RSSA_27]|uniref:T9SS type B sorting domain-containing protein n=1 Tax=Flavobacterium sp. RSSA_27 TaxID=3447667 RepID=UPI003F3507A7